MASALDLIHLPKLRRRPQRECVQMEGVQLSPNAQIYSHRRLAPSPPESKNKATFSFPKHLLLLLRLTNFLPSEAIRSNDLLVLSTADMDFGIRDTYAPCRPLSSSPSLTRLGAVNSELYSFRSKLSGLQPEADTDNDEGLNMFDDASCIFVEKHQTAKQPSTLSIPGISPMERTVIYHFPGLPFLSVSSSNLVPEPDYFGALSTDPERSTMIRSPVTPTNFTTTAITKRPSSTFTSPYHRKRARTNPTTDDDPDDSDWVFPELPAVLADPVKEQNPTFVLVLRRARTAAAGLRKKCRAAVQHEYQYLSVTLLCATAAEHQVRQPGPKTKCCVVGGGEF
ncbi:hypothetical protein B0T18DRAFT_29479 [Schizothecium vesticola]|uniref:Uncharacterized protein n=1 Tax=Schizothecium vesticola TaxID=314040 RepID=A0AA40FA75_9PEZI|nr:hypothetical protein B0T18DRAFT_29479 [Schizothecium vesticola]